jgi:hypothetical protein
MSISIRSRELAVLGFIAALPAGQAVADTKAAVQMETVMCQQNPSANPQGTGMVSIMSTSMANSQSSSFLVNASLVTGLLTNTTVTTNGGGKSTASATGSVQVGVMLDGNFDSSGKYLAGGTYAYPGMLSFDTRTQTLTATLGQALTGCSVVSGLVTCTGLTSQQIQLVLDTTAAHSFQFILPNVGVAPNSAPHRIDIVAQVSSSTLSSGLGSALASACYGAGTVTVDAVRLGNGFSCSNSGCSTT